MECTLNPQSLIHKQRMVSSFAPTLTLTNVQCGRHPRSQSLEHRVEDTQTLSLTLPRTQNGCYAHALTSHTHSDSHLSACSPSHTNNGGLVLSNLPQPLTRKKRAHPRLAVTHPQIEGRTPLTLISHTHTCWLLCTLCGLHTRPKGRRLRRFFPGVVRGRARRTKSS